MDGPYHHALVRLREERRALVEIQRQLRMPLRANVQGHLPDNATDRNSLLRQIQIEIDQTGRAIQALDALTTQDQAATQARRAAAAEAAARFEGAGIA